MRMMPEKQSKKGAWNCHLQSWGKAFGWHAIDDRRLACHCGCSEGKLANIEGEEGVLDIVNIYQNEMKVVMAHLGVSSVKEITSSLLS